VRLVNLETVARDSTAANYRATGFSTPAQVTAATTAVNAARDNVNNNTNAARDAVLDQGNTAWTTATGFATDNPDNLTLSRLAGLLTGDFTRFTTTALSNAPAGGGGGGGLTTEQNSQLFAIPTALAPAPSTIATAVQTALAPQLTTIAADAIKARAAHTNLAEVDEETATTTVFADNGTTPLFRVRTRDAGGVASVDSTYTREPVALT
jgi:hypothetical protein